MLLNKLRKQIITLKFLNITNLRKIHLMQRMTKYINWSMDLFSELVKNLDLNIKLAAIATKAKLRVEQDKKNINTGNT